MGEASETNEAAQRLAALEAEARDLRRQLSEARVEAQAQRAGRVEAEHQRDILVAEAGRRVLAIRSRKIVKRLRARVAELEAFEGSQTEAAMRATQDGLRLQRERDEAIKTANVFEGCAVKARGERDRAVTANRLAWKERDEARAEVERLRPLASAYHDIRRGLVIGGGDLSDGETVTPADVASIVEKQQARLAQAREHVRAIRRALAHLVPGVRTHPPAHGTPASTERTIPSFAWDEFCAVVGVEAEAKVERTPPFRDWTDEARAKLVPGASVVWWSGGFVESERVTVTNRPVENGGAWMVRVRTRGEIVIVALTACDPLTIEPPATQAEPVRAGAPDLRRGDRVCDSKGKEWTIVGSPFWWDSDGALWVHTSDGIRPIGDMDISTRVRTWQPGEVVPHAPGKFKLARRPDGPLAEPWTQTGV